jgi:small subunit ribosomal protein S2
VAVVTMKQMLEAGVHFGHQTRRWNPKMKRFIFGERNGIYIIDLNQTLQRVNTAYAFVRDLVAGGGTIMFVGTKKQTQDPVAEFAVACGMPYVNQRWLGGMLTNFQTVAGRVRKLQELETSRAAGDFEAMPKKEALQHQRELEKLERNLGGIRRLQHPPDAIFVIDTKKEHIAVTEANKLHMPVVAVVDTNCDPDVIDYVIPGNDDAIRAGRLMCRVIADAVAEGRFIASRRALVEAGGPKIGDAVPAGPMPVASATRAPGGAGADAGAGTGSETVAGATPAPAAVPSPAAAPAPAPSPAAAPPPAPAAPPAPVAAPAAAVAVEAAAAAEPAAVTAAPAAAPEAVAVAPPPAPASPAAVPEVAAAVTSAPAPASAGAPEVAAAVATEAQAESGGDGVPAEVAETHTLTEG